MPDPIVPDAKGQESLDAGSKNADSSRMGKAAEHLVAATSALPLHTEVLRGG